MADKVNVGVVSTSWWADMMHLPSPKSHTRADVVAICGRNHDRAEGMAEKYGIPRVFTDYREMFKRGDLHAIVIAAPDDMYYPMTIDALDAGLHVLCEKPLALNARQAKEMAERAAAAEVKHMVLFTWRWMPYFRYLRQLIDDGHLGRCFHCHFNWFPGFGRDTQYGWKWDRQRSLGTLGDLGSHMIDLAGWMIGDIVKVNAHLSSFVERPDREGQLTESANDSAVLTLEFENGAQGVIHVSSVAHPSDRRHEQQVILHGEAGPIEVDCNFGSGYVIRGARSGDDKFKTLSIPDHILGGINPNSPFEGQLNQVFTT